MISSYKPHPAQKQIHDRLKKWCLGLIVMVMAGRRFGKTLSAMAEIVKRAVEVPGSRIWYFAHTKDQAYRIAWRTLLYPRRKNKGKGFDPPLLPDHLIRKKRDDRYTVELYNNSLIELFGVGNEIFKLGAGLDFVVMDEFPAIPFSIWDDIVKPMLADVNGDALFIGTVPDPKKHDITIEFIDMFEKGLARPTKHLHSFNFSSFDNPHISHEYIKRDIEKAKKMGREKDAMRNYFGKYTREYGFVFPAFGERHIIHPLEEVPKEWIRINAMDPHPQKPYYSTWGAYDQDNTLWMYRERIFEHPSEGRPLTVSEIANDILRAEAYAGENIATREIDPTYAKVKQVQLKGKSILDLFRDSGLYYREAIRDFPPFFDEMTERLASDPPGFLITEDCPNTIRQLQNLRWEAYASPKAREEKGAKDRPKDVDNDLVDDIKYTINSKTRYVDPSFINRLKNTISRRWEKRELY